MTESPWRLSWSADPVVARLADGHYSRQTPGAAQFSPPGRKLVLKTPGGHAGWVTSWPYPEFVNRDWAHAWVNTLFCRRGGSWLASDMIRWAVAHSREKWPAIPTDGIITLVDASRISAKPGRYRTPGIGWCYLKAGWRHVGFTKGGLWVFQQLPGEMPPPRCRARFPARTVRRCGVTALVIRGDARSLALPDGSVDLVVTSPPFWGLRDYRDGGGSLAGQLGAEPTPQEYLAALLACMHEWMRVLKPSGSIFVNLGDTYANRADGAAGPTWREDRADALQGRRNTTGYVPRKSLLGLPWRFALACTDELGLILRRDIVWHKVNPLPESVTDRCRTSHEYLFHFVRQPRYYAAMDEIRTPHLMRPQRRPNGHKERQKLGVLPAQTYSTSQRDEPAADGHPLGALPGSVWEIPSAPLTAPAHLGVDHFAAFPPALVRPIVLAWSPPGICVECGEGRLPVVTGGRSGDGAKPHKAAQRIASFDWARWKESAPRTITGYACACTPCTDHPERRRPTVTPSRHMGRGHQDNDLRAAEIGTRHHGDDWPQREPVRDYHFATWEPPPARPAVVLDPFGGTGTTAMVADVLGRTGITVDRSADYCRLARWRTRDPGERARALGLPRPPVVPADQFALFDESGGEVAL